MRSTETFRRSVTGLLAAVLLSTTWGCGQDQAAPPQTTAAQPLKEKTTNVVLSTVNLQNLQDTFTLPGTLEAWEDLTLAAEMSGPVRWIGPREGDRVEEGEAILRIDPERREAELARDKVEYELQKKRLERRQSLANRNLVSQQELEDARQAFKRAQTRLQLSRVALKKSTLRSPVDGILDRLMVDRGEYVAEGTPAALVMQVHRLLAIVDVPEKDVRDLAVGDKARIVSSPVDGAEENGRTGKIIHLSYQADLATRTYQAKIEVDNENGTLRPGMIVRVGFNRRTLSEVIAVPLYALVDKNGGKVVFVEQDGKARRRQVTVGPIVGNLAVIEKGLKAGDRLVVKGQHLLSDGTAVQEEGR